MYTFELSLNEIQSSIESNFQLLIYENYPVNRDTSFQIKSVPIKMISLDKS